MYYKYIGNMAKKAVNIGNFAELSVIIMTYFANNR
jgi:hypothetical protein